MHPQSAENTERGKFLLNRNNLVMRLLFIVFLFGTSEVKAHTPDLSTVMIYEQNGRYWLVIKSSLTAFEGEIDFHYKKDAYHTPEEFVELVVRHFTKNSTVIINNDTILFKGTQVQLGHETTLFAELVNVPGKITSCYVKNTLFKDTPNHQSELIITAKGLPQKQCILYNGNNHELLLKVENGQWVIDDSSSRSLLDTQFILWALLFSLAFIIAVVVKYRKVKIVTLN